MKTISKDEVRIPEDRSLINELALIGAKAHIALFYEGGDLLVEPYDDNGRAELIEAFRQLGFDVAGSQAVPSFTIRLRDESPLPSP